MFLARFLHLPTWSFLILVAQYSLFYISISWSAPYGKFYYSPAAFLTVVEFIKLVVCVFLNYRDVNNHLSLTDEIDERISFLSSIGEIGAQLNAKVFAQLGSLGFVRAFQSMLFFGGFLLASTTTLYTFISLNTVTYIILSWIYLDESISIQQWLLIGLQMLGLLGTQWHACLRTSVSPLWVYFLLISISFMDKFGALWNTALAKHSETAYPARQVIVSFVGILMGLWAFFILPDSLYSSASISGFFGGFTLPTWIAVFVHSLGSIFTQSFQSRFNASQSTLAHGLAAALIIATDNYFLDYAMNYAIATPNFLYITATVLVSCVVVAIAALLYFSSGSSQLYELHTKASIQPPYLSTFDNDSFGSSVFTIGLPDFMVLKCKWTHWIIWIVLIVVGVFILSTSSSTTVEYSVQIHVQHTGLGPDGKVTKLDRVGFGDSKGQSASGIIEYSDALRSYDWKTRAEDEKTEIVEIEQMFWKRRNPDALLHRKDVAVCFAGNILAGWAQDLEWLYELYHAIGSYDAFLWLAESSIPLGQRSLNPACTSYLSSPPTPTGSYRKWRHKRSEIDSWATHMWGMGHCITLIEAHKQRTQMAYDWVIIAQPNTTFLNHPIPSMSSWEKTQIYFWPKSFIQEQMIFGEYDRVKDLVLPLHKRLTTWDGPKIARDYVQNVARAMNFNITVISSD